jgi:hypothetical protein
MFGLLSSLQFLNTTALLGIPLLGGLLVYFYMKGGRANEIVVSTSLFLKNFVTIVPARRKFIPPFRFFFELLLFALLFLGAAGLSLGRTSPQIAILIDNSLSTAAHLEEGLTRLDFIKKSAAEFIASYLIGNNSNISVYISSPSLQELTPQRKEQQESGVFLSGDPQEIVNSIPITYANDDLETALSQLVKDERYQEIHIWTDRKAGWSESLQEEQRIKLHAVNAESVEAQNVAFTGIRYDQPEQLVTVDLTAFTKKSQKGKVTVYGIYPDSNEALQGKEKKEGKILVVKEVLLEPYRPTAVRLNGLDRKFKFLKIIYTSSKVRTSKYDEENVLEEDDTIWYTRSEISKKIGVFSSYSIEELGLNNLPFLSIEKIEGTQFEDSLYDKYSGFIFHRVGTDISPKAPSLFVLPPNSNESVKPKNEQSQERSQIVWWDTGSPLLKYLNLNILSIEKGMYLQNYYWAKEVIKGEKGPLLIEGNFQGANYIAAGFELFPFETKRGTPINILTLNIVKSLFQDAAQTAQRSGETLSAGSNLFVKNLKNPDEIQKISYENGKTLYDKESEVNEKETLNKAIFLDYPGILKIERKAELKNVSLDSTSVESTEYIAVNFLNPEESDLLHQKSFSLPSNSISSRSKEQSDQQVPKNIYTSQISFFVLILLVIDMVFMLFKRRGIA